MVVQPGFLPQRCHFLHFSLFSQVVQDLFCRFYLPGAISVQHALSSWTRKRENGVGYENNFTFSVSVFNLSLTRLVIYMRPGLVMDVLRISAQRFSTFPNSISCTNIPRNSKDGKVRVLVAGGWSGHNIRTAEVNNFPDSFAKWQDSKNSTTLAYRLAPGVQSWSGEMEGGGRSLLAKKGLDTHGGKLCYDQMVCLLCPASRGTSFKFILERLRLQGACLLILKSSNIVPN